MMDHSRPNPRPEVRRVFRLLPEGVEALREAGEVLRRLFEGVSLGDLA